MGTVSTLKPRAKGSGVAFEPPPSQQPYRRETAAEIALRLRSGIGPTRTIVVRCLKRADDERWL